jgi:hypothetical protein
VSELDEAWAVGIAEAEARARTVGRADIAEYLALRNSNDLIRKISSDWLLGLFAEDVAEANRKGAAIQVATEEGHHFKVGNTNMIGTCLSFSKGVRQLVIEVGWPRTPRDGFMRGGGLAYANIKHVGIKAANEEFRLFLDEAGTPRWVRQDAKEDSVLHEANVTEHLSVLLNDSRPR